MFFRPKLTDGQAYEAYVADTLRRDGFRKLRFTAVTGDYGVDLIAEKGGVTYAVQCKYYGRPVGPAAVQEVAAGMAYYGCDRGMVVTNATFTRGAVNLAQANGVELLAEVDPARLTFWERRKAWQLVVLALEWVVYGLLLFHLAETGGLTLRRGLWLALLCFPLPYLAIGLGRLIWRLARPRPQEEAEGSPDGEDEEDPEALEEEPQD